MQTSSPPQEAELEYLGHLGMGRGKASLLGNVRRVLSCTAERGPRYGLPAPLLPGPQGALARRARCLPRGLSVGETGSYARACVYLYLELFHQKYSELMRPGSQQ